MGEMLASLDLGACCCQPPSGSNMLGSLIQKVFAQFDTSALGVEVDIGSLVLDPSSGIAEVAGLTVHNPEGYRSEYLLHADKIVIDIDMEKLLRSFGKELHIEQLVFDGIDVIYEQGLHGSNLHDLLKKLEPNEANEASEAKPRQLSTPEAGAEDVITAAACHPMSLIRCDYMKPAHEPTKLAKAEGSPHLKPVLH